MVISSCSVRFYIKPQGKREDKDSPIFCRIIYQRKKAEFFIGEHIPENKWDNTRGLPKRDPRLEQYLAKIKAKILTIKQEKDFYEEEVSAKLLKDIVMGKRNDHKISLMEYFQSKIDKYSALKDDYAETTIKKYNVSLNLLRCFTKAHYPGILVQDVDYKFISEWDDYLITCPEETLKTRSRNTANSYHKRLKKILGEAVKESILDKNPYEKFRLKDNRTTKEALSRKELELFINFPLGDNPSLIKAKDIFLFTCFTGVRFQDGQDLETSCIYEDDCGILWMKYKQRKSKSFVDFPLLESALQIIKKYKTESSITGKILPRISNQKTNQYLKVIVELIHMNRRINHHLARHTFAATILRENEIPHEATKEWLGHSTNNDITLLYAKLSRKIKIQYKQHLDKTLKNLYHGK